jgi:hypothetical protein
LKLSGATETVGIKAAKNRCELSDAPGNTLRTASLKKPDGKVNDDESMDEKTH